MYNKPYYETGLGQAIPGQSSTWRNILKVAEKGIEFGFNVADKIKQIQTAQKARKQAEEQAKALAQMQVSIPVQSIPLKPYTGPAWGMLALIGGGIALLALIFIKR